MEEERVILHKSDMHDRILSKQYPPLTMEGMNPRRAFLLDERNII